MRQTTYIEKCEEEVPEQKFFASSNFYALISNSNVSVS